MAYSSMKHSRWSICSAIILLIALSIIIFKSSLEVDAQATNPVLFAIGSGYTDVTTRQIIRSYDDRVFIFAAQSQYSPVLVAYRTITAGLPTGTNSFVQQPITVTESANLISVDAVYNGSITIHVLINTQAGAVKDYPFDITSNTFRAPILIASNGGTVSSGDYIGTAGVSGMVDLSGHLHISYWSNSNHIVHQAYTYDAVNNVLNSFAAPTQVDAAGSANHPALAISPANNSVTIAWVSQVTAPIGRIMARTRSATGVWGAEEVVSTADAWTSTAAGINIDQGPSLIISSNGTKYISYIQDNDTTGSYGRAHFATFGSVWNDSPVAVAGTNAQLVINGSSYTHTPALTTDANGQLYIIGHGPILTNVGNNMYTMRRNSNGTWGVPSLYVSGNSFDSSPSVKWAAVGNNRPNTYEFVFFLAPNGLYNNAVLYYGRFGDGTPVATQSAPVRNYFTTNTPTLTWGRVSWATAYEIQVDRAASFTQPLDFSKNDITTDMLSITMKDLDNGVYYWRVRALQASSVWGAWSTVESFEVAVP